MPTDPLPPSRGRSASGPVGLPTVSIPVGFEDRGLPVGMQLAARPLAEATALKVADAHQRDTDWHARVPAL